jgi:carotenoid cleavage dioxygenase-like enzyme
LRIPNTHTRAQNPKSARIPHASLTHLASHATQRNHQGAHGVTHEVTPDGAPFVEEAYMHRFVLDVRSRRVVESAPLSAVASDFPVVHPSRVGRPTRFAFAAGVHGGGRDPITLFDSLVKHDLASGDVVRRPLPPGVLCGDVSFAPRVPGGDGDGDGDDGHILLLTHVLAEDRAEMLVLDAKDILAPPVATVHIPVRVPFGFHCEWVPGALPHW